MAPRFIPAKGECPNAKSDARTVFDVLKAGGVVIIPTEVGYGLISSSAEGIERSFRAKQRKPGHTLGVLGTWTTHRQLHDLPEDKFTISRTITEEFGSVLAIVAPCHQDHPRLQKLSEQTRERIFVNNTLGIAILEGPFGRELGRLVDEDGGLIVGSSANVSGKGQKFRIEDIEPEVRNCADLIIDYGLQRYWIYGRAGTNIDLHNMKVLRIGAAYEVFAARLKKWFDIDLPKDPDFDPDDEAAKSVGTSLKLQK